METEPKTVADRRKELHMQLMDILGSRNVYYNPPETLKMSYPCIRYNLNGIRKGSADDGAYKKNRNYTIVLIHKDADNEVVDDILDLPMCSLDRTYVADNLHHFIFTKYI